MLDIDTTCRPEALRCKEQRYGFYLTFLTVPGPENEALTPNIDVSGPKNEGSGGELEMSPVYLYGVPASHVVRLDMGAANPPTKKEH